MFLRCLYIVIHQLLPPRGFSELHCPPLYVISPPMDVWVPPRLARERVCLLCERFDAVDFDFDFDFDLDFDFLEQYLHLQYLL